MAKRECFLPQDFEIFNNDAAWEKKLKSRVVDYQICEKFKFEKNSYVYNDQTLLAMLVTSTKGIDLPKDQIAEKLGASINLSFVSYLESKGIHAAFPSSLKAVREIQDDSIETMCEFLGNDWSSIRMMGLSQASVKKEMQAKTSQSMQILDYFLNDCKPSQKQLKELLESISPTAHYQDKYINSNEIPVGLFDRTDYFKSMKLKPAELFNADTLKLIGILESKIGVAYLDKDPENTPRKRHEEVCKERGKSFNSQVTLEYRDGSKVELNTRSRFK